MENKFLQPQSLDDIIFEHRNKQYGAYALRSGYNNRMLMALGAGMTLILLGVFIFMNQDNAAALVPVAVPEEGLVVRTIELPQEKPPQPEKPKEARVQKAVEKTAMVKYISNIKIEKEVKEEMAPVQELDGAAIGDHNEKGKEADGTVEPADESRSDGNGTGVADPVQPDFTAVERGPEFPGGAIALKKFLARNLASPDNLERGELKTVRVRFKVDRDGTVSSLEILSSGGDNFDDEVVRVCRRMPKWIPALQNGVNVPVSYILPVTFMGSE